MLTLTLSLSLSLSLSPSLSPTHTRPHSHSTHTHIHTHSMKSHCMHSARPTTPLWAACMTPSLRTGKKGGRQGMCEGTLSKGQMVFIGNIRHRLARELLVLKSMFIIFGSRERPQSCFSPSRDFAPSLSVPCRLSQGFRVAAIMDWMWKVHPSSPWQRVPNRPDSSESEPSDKEGAPNRRARDEGGAASAAAHEGSGLPESRAGKLSKEHGWSFCSLDHVGGFGFLPFIGSHTHDGPWTDLEMGLVATVRREVAQGINRFVGRRLRH